ncbi:hypothetical protein E2C01_060916 [Portunus trituberculatus]|uniref:Uncharacterized protein n=1 Tax=Portunus trituberculatus TaxID=210409 RepID=A0A5B7H9D8_PORTR|nr:hypothetical protein [Portunus trituberculatus]
MVQWNHSCFGVRGVSKRTGANPVNGPISSPLVSPGGFVIIVMREENLVTVEAYRDKLEPHMDSLVERGYWTRVTRKVVPYYFCDKDGLVLTYRVL